MQFNLGLRGGLIASTARPVPTTAPENVVLPTVSGIETEGQTLTAAPGSWLGIPAGVFEYQWQRGGVDIGGATSQTYVIQAADVGEALTVEVTATNDIGSTTAESIDTVTPVAALSISDAPGSGVVGTAYSYSPTVSGGHTPRTYALTGTLPAGLSFNTSTGAITGTPISSATASGLDITVTDADGLTDSLGAFSITIGAALVAAHYDSFTGALDTQLHGRALTQGGLSWTVVNGSTAVTNNARLDGTGELYVSSAAANALMCSAGYSDAFWVHRRIGPFWGSGSLLGNIGAFVHGSYAGDGSSNLWNKVLAGFTVSAPGLAGFNTYETGATPIAAATAATQRDTTASNIQLEAGDTFGIRHRKVGAAVYLDLYHNNHLVRTGAFDFAAANAFLNGQVGFGLTTAWTTGNRMYSDIWFGDPTTRAFITLNGSPRVRQTNANGSCTFYLWGEYSGSAPAALKWSLFDVTGGSSEVAVGNVTSVTLTNLQTTAMVNGVGTWTAQYTVAAADLPARFTHQVEWEITAGTTVVSKSGVERKGVNLAYSGQSLQAKKVTTNTSGATPSGWLMDGTTENAAADSGRRTLKGRATDWSSRFVADFVSRAGISDSLTVGYISLGKGSTFFLDPVTPANGRSVGSTIYTALTEGLARAGKRVAMHTETMGQYEAINFGGGISGGFAANATYRDAVEAALIAAWNDMEDRMGLARYSLPIVMTPLNQYYAATPSASRAADWEAMRRFIWMMVKKYEGTRPIYEGPETYDQQHVQTDPYHTLDFTETMRREAALAADILGYTSVNLNGPTIASVTKIDAQTVDVTFSLNSGGDTIEIVNANAIAASGYNGGLRFSTASSFSSLVNATGASVTSTTTIRFTFPASSFTGTVYVGGPYGDNPFNPTQSGGITSGSGINGNFATQACMIREHFADASPSVPLRPYYNPAFLTSAANDYMSDS
jgi:hypothetical protein